MKRLPRPSECRNCQDPIRFVKLNTGSALPVNPKPGETGNVAAGLYQGRLVGYVLSAENGPRASHPYRFVPHYATCEHELARKRKPTAPAVEPDPSLF